MIELELIKSYLENRINSQDLLSNSNQQLLKYLNTSYMLLNTYYIIQDIDDENKLIPVIGEQMLFLFNSNIDLNLFYQYQGLTSFNIGKGSVQGTIDLNNKGTLFSQIVKGMLEALGIDQRIEDPCSKVKNGFTWT